MKKNLTLALFAVFMVSAASASLNPSNVEVETYYQESPEKISGTQVKLSLEDYSSSEFPRTSSTGSLGEIIFYDVIPGDIEPVYPLKYKVTGSKRCHASETQNFEILYGGQDRDIDLELEQWGPYGEYTAEVVNNDESVEGASVTIQKESDRNFEETVENEKETGEDGKASFNDLPYGEYDVSVEYSPEGSSDTVTRSGSFSIDSCGETENQWTSASDTFSFNIENSGTLEVDIREEESGKILEDVRVRLYSEGELLKDEFVSYGETEFTLDASRDYRISASKDGYSSDELTGINIDRNSVTGKNLYLSKEELDTGFSWTPDNPNADEEVVFQASDSSRIEEYGWDFDGDGYEERHGQTATWSFDSAGSKPVTLTVEEGNREATSTEIVEVSEKPECGISPGELYLDDDTVDPGETVELSLQVYNSGSDQDVKVEFVRDGVLVDNSTGEIDNEDEEEFTASFSTRDPGDYSFRAKIITLGDDCGTQTFRTEENTLEVRQKTPTASFSFEPGEPVVGETVSFDASSSRDNDQGGEKIERYEWNFDGDAWYGDKTGKEVTKSFEEAGTYSVGLKVTDNEGYTDTTTRTVNVESGKTSSPEIELLSPEKDETDVDIDPEFSWIITDEDDSQMQEARLYVKKKSKTGTLWNSYDHRKDIDRDTGSVRSKQLGEELEKGSTYVWGIRVSDGENVVKSGIREFTVRGESARKGTLDVTVQDREGNLLESTVNINGDSYTVSGSRQIDLSPGNYDVTASSDGYQEERKEVVINSGETTETTFELDKTELGKIIHYTPAEGSKVQNPVEISLVLDRKGNDFSCYWSQDSSVNDRDNQMEQVGDYRFRSTEDFETGQTTIYMACFTDSEKAGQVSTQFEVKEEVETGTLEINVRDSETSEDLDAKVEIEDGVDLTEYTGNDGKLELELKEDNYDVTVSKEGYLDEERQVYIPAGKRRELNIYLSPESGKNPVANLQVRPDPAEVGDEITFDARNSYDPDGTIEQYKFDFDGDGSWERTGSKNIYTVDFADEELSRTAILEVVDNDGNSDRDSEFYRVEKEPQECRINAGSLRLSDTVIERGDEIEARLTVFNDMEEDQDVLVLFETESESRTVTKNIPDRDSGGERTFRADFEPEEDTEVSAEVRTLGGICGTSVVSTQERDVDVRDEEENARLEVQVRDEDSDDLEDARVEVENGDDEVEYTDDDGEAEFELEPGEYDIKVSKDGYRTEEREDFELEAGEDRKVSFRLETAFRKDLSMDSINHPESVCRGEDLRVRVLSSNHLDQDEEVTLKGEGLGSVTSQSFEIPEDQSRVRTLTFPDVRRETPGNSEKFTLTLENGDFHTRERTVIVEDCEKDIDPGQATGASMELSPSKVLAGEPVKVSGVVRGTKGRKDVTLRVNGFRKAKVSTEPDGYYQAYITPTKIGKLRVTATVDSITKARELEVMPTASIDYIDAPSQVFQGDTFEVCGNEIRSEVTPKVYLIRDGEAVQSRNSNGQVCFDVEAGKPGEKEFTVAAVAGNQRSTASKDVEVLETNVEARNFPDQIASVESGSGMVKTTLYNNHDELRRYTLEIDDIPGTWTSQSEKQALLEPGEKRKVYFYITPQDEGRFESELEVSRDGEQIYSQDVPIVSGGSTNQVNRRSWIARILENIGL